MKTRPIIFSAPMVRAILAGTKTQTRRVVKPHHLAQIDLSAVGCVATWSKPMPYGRPGDRLWVRETHMIEPHPADVGLQRQDIPHTWDAAVAAAGTVIYAADPMSEFFADGRHWTPSIHMPRTASRITLEIVSVRVERLQDISEADAQAEGVEAEKYGGLERACARAYSDLWESINGPGSWGTNPWVWVVEFKRVEVPA